MSEGYDGFTATWGFPKVDWDSGLCGYSLYLCSICIASSYFNLSVALGAVMSALDKDVHLCGVSFSISE